MNKFFTIFNQQRGGILTLLFCLIFSTSFVVRGSVAPAEVVKKGNASAKRRSQSPKSMVDDKSSSASTFENPDFAFPKDISKNALPIYEKALKDKNGELAIKAAMQLAIADQLVNLDSIRVIIGRYDKIGETFPTPWKDMALLLKAKMLNNVYSSNSWKFDQRQLPKEELNPESMLWSGKQYKSQIALALNSIFANSAFLATLTIRDISGILTNTEDAQRAGFSVLDFATYQAMEIARNANVSSDMIPFREVRGKSVADDQSHGAALSSLSLIDNLINADAERGSEGEEALFRARLMKITYSQNDNSVSGGLISGYPAHLLELYPNGSPFRAALLIALYQGGQFNTSNSADAGKLYRLLEETLADSNVSESERSVMKGIMAQLLQPAYNLSCKGQWLPEVKGQIILTSRNVTNGNLLLVPISASQCEGESGDKLMNMNLKPVGKIENLLHLSQPIGSPSERTDTILTPGLKAGYYALVMSETEDMAGLYPGIKRSRPDIVLVSSLNVFSSDDSKFEEGSKIGKPARLLYVTDGHNNSPLEGVKVGFSSTAYNSKGKTSTAITDKDGKVTIPFEQCRAIITRGKDRLIWNGGSGYAPSSDDDQLSASILTDLALYRPGDTIQTVIILCRQKDNLLSVAEANKCDLILHDANYKEVTRKSLVTDSFGRAVCSLNIPEEGLTGRFSLQVSDGNHILGRTSVQVAEYQAPTFRVNLQKPEVEKSATAKDDEIRISGSVMTYSGAPISDAEVDISINFMPWWRPWMWSRSAASSYSVKTTTDSQGCYSVKLLLSAEDARNYQFGYFSATATATIPAGEAEASSAETFGIGEGYSLQFAGNADITVTGKEINLPVRVVDMLGNPAQCELSYDIVTVPTEESDSDFKNPIISGTFSSPNIIVPSTKLPSSLYLLRVIMPKAVRIEESDGNIIWRPDTLKTHFIIMRPDDRTPPVSTSLWVPELTYYAHPDQKNVEVIVGSSYRGNAIYCQIADGNGTLRREWLYPRGENMTVKVPAPKDGETVRLFFAGCHDLETAQRTVTIYPPRESRKTLFRVDTFRDKLRPGSSETWKFRLMSGWPAKTSGDTKSESDDRLSNTDYIADGAVIAVLSNASLDAITPFNWRFTPNSMIGHRTLGGVNIPWRHEVSSYENLTASKSIDYSSSKFVFPEFLYNNFRDFGAIKIRGVRYYASSSKAMLTSGVDDIEAGMAMDDSAPEIAYLESSNLKSEPLAMASSKQMRKATANGTLNEEVAVEADSEDGFSRTPNDTTVELRSMEMPLAFFKPLLTTDTEGYAVIEFEVPNFNTEWNLQLLGYDHQLNSTILRKSAVASKPVMVMTSMPRFLTTGDVTQISATVINNTDAPLSIDTEIEIFDIISGKVIARHSSGALEFSPNSTQDASIDFTVSSDYSQLGVRTIAKSAIGSDGEQGVLQVLPSSTPVSDAITFYFQPGCDEKSIQLPKMKPEDKVTLNIFNNPEWLVLTALSGKIEPDSESALVQAAALYSNAVAGGLIEKHQGLRKGLETMIASGDSILISPLQQNQSLKLAALNSTPWVNDAESETQRMANLSSLLDKEGMKKSIIGRIEGLKQTNNSDGSWSWMKGMPGTEWITRQVISCLGSLRQSGYLPEDKALSTMISNGIRYCDLEVSKDYNETVKKYKNKYPLAEEIEYLYVRSSATEFKPSGTILEMKRDMLRRLPSEWKSLSLIQKSTAAILLNKEGSRENVRLANTIMESVKQFATYSPDKGMWFDTASEGWMSPSPLWLTTRCLESFRALNGNENKYHNEIIGLEQYLILSRQTRDWNLELGEAGVAAIVNSILTDTDYNGMEGSLSSGELQVFLDGVPVEIKENGYVNLDPANASGKILTIHRHGDAPGWGGVLNQYVAPIEDVKANEVPQLKVFKSLLPVEINNGSAKAMRDTETFRKGDRIRVTLTIETDRDMDYILLTDRLGSWMQPTEQLTRYKSEDGLWLLRETRRSDVNFYITKIPKGKYVVTYDVTASRDGRYSTGLAAAQCLYYPMITSHTSGRMVTVKD